MTQWDVQGFRQSVRPIGIDVLWILGLALLVLGSGLGVRDPWPADEPRFALIARDMVEGGQWLFPRIGGDWYPDKPPAYFWIVAALYTLTGSLRLAFLLPSLLASVGTLFLVYDLGRRLWDRQSGFTAALALLFTLQFTLQAHMAQIDAVLCFWITLSLYGFCRHLLRADGWRWYALGGFAAGLGVITKGVGFLPFLILIPYALARRWQWKLPHIEGEAWRWALAPATFALGIGLWLMPMLVAVAVRGDPQLAVYRDEILFHQTVGRYASAWHHQRPFYYYLGTILGLWLPLILLLPWLVGRWWERLRKHDARVLLLVSWIVLVLLFFTLSSGKRGVYILPALPAFAVVSGPWLAGLAQRPDVRRTLFALALFGTLLFAAVFVALQWFLPEQAARVEAELGLPTFLPLAIMAIGGAVALAFYRTERAPQACAAVIAIFWFVAGWWIAPVINDHRSGRIFMEQVQATAAVDRPLALLAYKEQFLLYLERSAFNFGHARWREGRAEAQDAAAWLNQTPEGQLLVSESHLPLCFATSPRTPAGTTSREAWWIVSPPADASCAAAGDASRARLVRAR
ncbi:MAG TPA: glycosyltransferase family 39 protein [Steroidobacteraceae bacterium]|nr:glycosyltransferase family 39 protein [Steroidobacteraceae bacterium]